MVNVSWDDALAYCRWLSEVTGKAYSLPSEAEWEKGARGTDGRTYPWGNNWDSTRYKRLDYWKGGILSYFPFTTSLKDGSPNPVGSSPRGASPYGILDMVGNTTDWTRSLWGENLASPVFKYPYQPNDGREVVEAPDTIRRVHRGGVFPNPTAACGVPIAAGAVPFISTGHTGFRIVMLPAF